MMDIRKTGLLLSAGVLMTAASLSARAKTGRTFFTADQVRNIRENIRDHEWARKIRAAAVAAAARTVDKPYSELAGYVPDPRIPRAAYVHETGCPNCGLGVRKFGNYAWRISEDKPYKVECPNCKSVYPSNDFQAFVDSGFKDRSLLTGDHPDDGWGWASPKDAKHKYWFVAWYNHWMTNRRLLPAIRRLSEAYLYTDDPKYARKCAVMLWQLAAYYPDYDYANQSRRGLEFDRSYYGRLLYYTWETFTVQVCSKAYDAIFPGLLEPCPELEGFTGQSLAEVRSLIEEQLLRSMAREIVNETHYIGGNYGMHQVGLLQIAAALKDTPGSPSSEDMVRWILDNEEYNIYIYMPIYDALHNLVYRDGVPFESPGYNLSWVTNLTVIADLLRVNGVDVSENPRFRKLYDWTIRMVCAGDFTPSLGDSGNISSRGRMWREAVFLSAYRTYKDPLYAKALLSLNPNAGRDIAAAPIAEELKRAAAALETAPGYASQHLAGYGLATLQNGNPAHPIAASLFYGQFMGHSHHDKMHLDIFAENASLVPDFGYPETANSNDPRRAGFFAHTVSHNTVMVDMANQAAGRGRCLAYDAGPGCQYVDARNDNVYPQCQTYRRSVAMVSPAPDRSFLVDVFRVRGGRQHDWLVHGTHADFESSLPLSAPRQGTLAGPEVKYGFYYDDELLGKAAYGSVNYWRYKGSAFQFLYNVQEAALAPGASATWRVITGGDRACPLIRGAEGAFLKTHLIGEAEHVFACDGKPQQNRRGMPEQVKFLVRRRTGEDLASTFVTVFEPGAGSEWIKGVTRLPTPGEDSVALRLDLHSGATYYYFNAVSPIAETEFDGGVRFAGCVGCLGVDARGAVEQAYLYNATLLARGDWRMTAPGPVRTTIASCDYRQNAVTLSDPIPDGRQFVGATAVIDSGRYGSAFVVKGVAGERKLLFGDQDPIVGRAAVKSVKAEAGELTTPTMMYFVQPDMHVVNEAMAPVGRVESFSRPRLRLTGPCDASRVTDGDGDGATRVYVMEFGPGDRVTLCTSVRYARKQE